MRALLRIWIIQMSVGSVVCVFPSYTPALARHAAVGNTDSLVEEYFYQDYTNSEIIGFLALRHGIILSLRSLKRLLKRLELGRGAMADTSDKELLEFLHSWKRSDKTSQDKRAQEVKLLVEDIRRGKKNKEPKTAKPKSAGKASLSAARPRKVNIGWLHKSGKKYKQVRFKEGGGVRQIHFAAGEEVTIPALIEGAQKLFFPAGTSKFGPLLDMNSQLGNIDFVEQVVENTAVKTITLEIS